MRAVEVGAFEAKNRLAHLLTLVERGQRVFITRRGRRVALLTRAEDADALAVALPEDSRDLLGRFRAVRRAARPGPESLRELVEDGRR
jgi:prevent-host-death family protein